MENLIQTKEEIFSHPKTKHIILNIDDANFSRWQKLNEGKKITTLSLIGNADYVMKSDEGKHTTIWSKDNVWTVEEDFDTVMKIINE